jgi:hypothetical protein
MVWNTNTCCAGSLCPQFNVNYLQYRIFAFQFGGKSCHMALIVYVCSSKRFAALLAENFDLSL